MPTRPRKCHTCGHARDAHSGGLQRNWCTGITDGQMCMCAAYLAPPTAPRKPRPKPAPSPHRVKRLPPHLRTDALVLDLVGPSDIAKRLGMRDQTVHAWRQRKILPQPLAVVSTVPIWDWPAIEHWYANRKYKKH